MHKQSIFYVSTIHKSLLENVHYTISKNIFYFRLLCPKIILLVDIICEIIFLSRSNSNRVIENVHD